MFTIWCLYIVLTLIVVVILNTTMHNISQIVYGIFILLPWLCLTVLLVGYTVYKVLNP